MDSSSNWSQYFVSLKRIFYFIITFLSVTFNLVDMYITEMHEYVVLFNKLNLAAVFLVFVLYLFKKINLQWSTGIVLYAAILNLLFSLYMCIGKPDFDLYLFRNTIIIVAGIPFIGFIIKKIHSIIVGVLYFAATAAMVVMSKNAALIENLAMIYLILSFFVGANYFLLKLLESALYKQSELIKRLSKQNTELVQKSNELEKTNTQLSEQKKIVDAQKQDLTEINQSKDTFFSIISHDLKAPFNAMLGFSSLMTDAFKKKEYDRAESYSRFISKSSKQGYYLLENLLEWSQTQSNRISYKPFSFEMLDLVNETVDLLFESAAKKEIKINMNVPKGLLVFADRNMIFTVMRNLLSNAIKYTTEFGQIGIDVLVSKEHCEVSVSDTGIGISKENMERLFRIDEHYSTSGTNNESGTGLGLILCKEFIEKNGGKIWVQSEPGNGSQFSFSLPLNH